MRLAVGIESFHKTSRLSEERRMGHPVSYWNLEKLCSEAFTIIVVGGSRSGEVC
jgi:hypothetical protein